MECHLRRDEATDTNRLPDREDPVPRHGSGNSIAIRPWCLLAEPLKEVGRVRSLALRVRQWLAVLPGDQRRDVFRIGNHLIVPATQQTGTLTARLGLERLEGGGRGIDGSVGVGGCELGACSDVGAGAWVCDDDAVRIMIARGQG